LRSHLLALAARSGCLNALPASALYTCPYAWALRSRRGMPWQAYAMGNGAVEQLLMAVRECEQTEAV